MVTVPMETASPRKKPRKQHFITTDDQYASNVPLEEGNNKYKEMVDEDDHWHKEPKARAMSGQSGVTKDSLDSQWMVYDSRTECVVMCECSRWNMLSSISHGRV